MYHDNQYIRQEDPHIVKMDVSKESEVSRIPSRLHSCYSRGSGLLLSDIFLASSSTRQVDVYTDSFHLCLQCVNPLSQTFSRFKRMLIRSHIVYITWSWLVCLRVLGLCRLMRLYFSQHL